MLNSFFYFFLKKKKKSFTRENDETNLLLYKTRIFLVDTSIPNPNFDICAFCVLQSGSIKKIK